MGIISHLYITARKLRGIIFAIPVAVTVCDYVGYVAKVEGASMQPVLNPDISAGSDYVFLLRWGISQYNFQRGDIVSLYSPRDHHQKLIKRIVALERDHIKTLTYRRRTVKIPDGHCWLEGDHHRNSLDSNILGPVSVGLIYARATAIVWPPSRWQALSSARSLTDRIVRQQSLLTES